MAWLKRYLLNILLAIDRVGNALIGGYPDETISSHAGKLLGKKAWANRLCRFLSLFDKRHCEDSINMNDGKP
jgi:hypothetical protein